PAFAPELIALTGSKDAAVSVAAMQALGRIHPDPEKAVGALEQILKTGSVGQRRAAAEALLNLIQVSAEVVKKVHGEEEHRRALHHQVRAGREAVLAAAQGVKYSDAAVRRFCLDTIQQAARSLADQVVIPPPDTLNFPPPDRKIWSEEEVQRAQQYCKEVEDELARLGPLMGTLRDAGRDLLRALDKEDHAVVLVADALPVLAVGLA